MISNLVGGDIMHVELSGDQEESFDQSDSVRNYQHQDGQDYYDYKHDDYKDNDYKLRTDYYQDAPNIHSRSDTESEPLSYNSRPPGRIKHHPYISEGFI
jgi:hypothetical protein